jgi:ribosomal protein S20
MQKAISDRDAKPVAKDLQGMISAIDRAAKRGIIHQNAARRRKARLNRSITSAAMGERGGDQASLPSGEQATAS